jgi:hypothetical protein
VPQANAVPKESAHRGQGAERRESQQELWDDRQEGVRGEPADPRVSSARMIDATVAAARTRSSSVAAVASAVVRGGPVIYFFVQPRISTAPFPLRSVWSRGTVSVCAGRSRSSPLVSPRRFSRSYA